MKKTIKDLRIGDSVWHYQDGCTPKELPVNMISFDKLTFGDHEFRISEEERTCFALLKTRYSGEKFYEYHLSKLDAFNKFRKRLDIDMEEILFQQSEYLKRIQRKNA